MGAGKAISLLEVLRERGTDLALVASYNVYFPFFEDVVLRRLRSAGCSYVVLMMDSGQLSAALREPETRPRLAGLEYGVLPVRAPGAFHPKFFLLVGKQRSRLLVGSHNLTLAGFGLNREITTLIDSDAGLASRQPYQATWQFVREWTANLLPKNLELLRPFERLAAWLLDEPEAQTEESALVLASTRTGPALWNQLRPYITHEVSGVTILGPSFDERLDFVRTLDREIRPRDLVVAVDPASSSISAEAEKRLPKARFVDLSKDRWKGDHACVHAKAYRFRLRGGGEVLVSGSANPSRQAWTASGAERNAELVLVQRFPLGSKLPAELRLDSLAELPEVSPEGWAEVATRRAAEAEIPRHETAEVEMAAFCEDGFIVSKAFGSRVSRVDVNLVSSQEARSHPDAVEAQPGGFLIRVRDRHARESTMRLEVSRPTGTAIAIVQRVESLLEDALDDTRRALRIALSGLEGDPTQLEEMFKLVERAIFDAPESFTRERPGSSRPARGVAAESMKSGGFAASISDTPLGRRLARARVGSDLSALLDVFIFKLGPLHAASLYAAPPHEAAGDVPDGGDTDLDPNIGFRMADLCRKKTHRLTRRLVKRLEEASEGIDGASLAVVRLAAALGLIHFLRSREHSFLWRPAAEDLVDIDDRRALFLAGTRLLFARQPHGLAARALLESNTKALEELSSAKALLCWLAFDCGLDLGAPLQAEADYELDQDDIWDDLSGRAYLLQSLSEALGDDKSRGSLVEETARYESGAGWLERHAGLSGRIQADRKAHVRKAVTHDLETGDIVFSGQLPDEPATVVLWANGQKAAILDLSTGEEKKYLLRYLRRVEVAGWRPIR